MSQWADAIRAGDAATLNGLLEVDPSFLEETENGATPVLLAIYHGKADLARMLAARHGRLSIGEACALGDAPRVREMLAADASLIEARTPDGFPLVGLAIFFGHSELARFLIENGADVNAAASNPLRVAPVHAAAAACDHQTMRLLLDRGADPNARQQLDYTPLHGAASRGDIEMAKMLMAHGADPAPRSADGLTPSDVARTHDKPEFAAWFEGRQADSAGRL